MSEAAHRFITSRSGGVTNPDAALIALCAQHIVNLAAFNAYAGLDDNHDAALWAECRCTRDAITDARPQTVEGMIAKARAAKLEALNADGTEEPENGRAARWAWQILNDMLRLNEGAGILCPPESGAVSACR
jgi:hypothetical protein